MQHEMGHALVRPFLYFDLLSNLDFLLVKKYRSKYSFGRSKVGGSKYRKGQTDAYPKNIVDWENLWRNIFLSQRWFSPQIICFRATNDLFQTIFHDKNWTKNHDRGIRRYQPGLSGSPRVRPGPVADPDPRSRDPLGTRTRGSRTFLWRVPIFLIYKVLFITNW